MVRGEEPFVCPPRKGYGAVVFRNQTELEREIRGTHFSDADDADDADYLFCRQADKKKRIRVIRVICV